MKLATRLARRFIAGETRDEALGNVRRLNKKGVMATLDVLGESVRDRETAEKAGKDYLELLASIRKAGVDATISLKLTQMGLDIDTEYCLQNVDRIASEAEAAGNFVRIDMEGTAYTQRTLDLFTRLRQKHEGIGVTIQACLRRSESDLRELNKTKARIRICKGAYKEPPDLAYQAMKDIRANFLRIAELAFKEGVYPAIATHDNRLIKWTREFTAANQIAESEFEFQHLYGIRDRAFERLVEEGYRVRCYVPFGTYWLPYILRRLRERKTLFLIKYLFERRYPAAAAPEAPRKKG